MGRRFPRRSGSAATPSRLVVRVEPGDPAAGGQSLTLDGQPARIAVRRDSTRRTSKSYVNCTTGATQLFLTAWIHGPSANVQQIEVGAVICGPDFAAGEVEVREMLNNLRFTG